MVKRQFEKRNIPEAGEGKRGEKGYLGYLLRQAAATHRARAETALAPLGVTLPQFLSLTMIGAYPGLSNADLARLALLTPQTVNVIVANLEKSDAIERNPHPVHGRIRQLSLTPKGRDMLSRARANMHAIDREIAADLTPEEEQVIRRWLASLALASGD
ncbi:MAG: MarR family transcriptional regulator [Alphaproteobacteria bacterium]|nr:MAG: MarR family transcriptional regulator [Alphaproteobacteria bacterium]